MSLPVQAFKGHALFVWKESSQYLFAWLSDTNALISRKKVLNARQLSECAVVEQMKKMKGLQQTIKMFLIESPRSRNFTNKNHNPMLLDDDFIDLINKLKNIAKENKIDFKVKSFRSYESIQDGF